MFIVDYSSAVAPFGTVTLLTAEGEVICGHLSKFLNVGILIRQRDPLYTPVHRWRSLRAGGVGVCIFWGELLAHFSLVQHFFFVHLSHIAYVLNMN